MITIQKKFSKKMKNAKLKKVKTCKIRSLIILFLKWNIFSEKL